jgi:hypothetical protein
MTNYPEQPKISLNAKLFVEAFTSENFGVVHPPKFSLRVKNYLQKALVFNDSLKLGKMFISKNLGG